MYRDLAIIMIVLLVVFVGFVGWKVHTDPITAGLFQTVIIPTGGVLVGVFLGWSLSVFPREREWRKIISS